MAARLPTFGDLLAARQRLGTLACRTPLIEHPALNALVGGRVLLKAENLQRVGAFKFRGAYNKMSQVDKAAFPGGVVACSSGNHAQGVAAAATLMGLQSAIVMPADAPRLKIERTRGVRRRGGAPTTASRRIATPSRASCAPARARRLRAPLRRSRRDRRPGHRRAGDDGAGRGDRCGARHRAGGCVGRRADQRRLDRGEGEDARRRIIYSVEPAGFDDLARSLKSGERTSATPRCRARSATRCWRRRRASSPSRWPSAIWPAACP